MPVCLSRPRDMELPAHLEPYSPASHYQRELLVTNAVTALQHHDPSDDWGGEDIDINILSHDGLPAVELAISMCPSANLAKKIRRCALKARAYAADKSLDNHKSGTKPRSNPVQDAVKPAKSRKKDRQATICQVSLQVDETLAMLQKLMPGKRLSDAQMRDLAVVLTKNHAAFAKDSKDYGKVTEKYHCHHSIATDDAKPVHQKPYRHSKFEEDFLRGLVEELQKAGMIRPSASPWISPVVLVKKKDGGLRMCIDFRKLNAVTKRDPYQLPRIDSLIDKMQGCSYFSSIDVLSAFWNVPMAEEDIQKTGFTTSFGNYEWNRMPFGLINASSTFQRLMDKVTSGISGAAAYIDDVFVFTSTWEEHLQSLDNTLSRLIEAGLKCKLSKCSFGGDSVKCLGQMVSEKGVTIDEDKIQAIKDLPRPMDATGVRSFVGVVNYFRQFIQGYAEIAAPLFELTKKKVEWDWTPACEQAFQILKSKLCEKPVLAMPDFNPGHSTFRLHTDWSKTAIGAVLLQKDRETGVEHAIAYASRILTSAERNYAPTEGECLAVVWAVKKFRHYLHGRPFEILTDHHALKWLQEARFTNSKLERWALALQEHDYKIDYQKGEDNVIADCLSRAVESAIIAWESQCFTQCNDIHADLCDTGVQLDDLSKTEHMDMIRCAICNDPGGANNMAFCSGCDKPFHLRCHLPPLATVPIGEWYCLSCNSSSGQLEELCDPDTLLEYSSLDFYQNDALMECVRTGGVDSAQTPQHRRALKRFLKKVRMHPTYPGWIQVRTRSMRSKVNQDQPWRTSPPKEYRWGIIRMYHDMLGHAGIEHTQRVLSKQVYWPNIKKDVSAFCMACMVCQQRKAVMYESETMENTAIHGALKHIHVDLAGPFKLVLDKKAVTFEATVASAQRSPRRSSRKREPAKQASKEPALEPQDEQQSQTKNRKSGSPKSMPNPSPVQQHWVLVIIDYFTKAAELVAVPSKSAECIARALWDNWFCRYGVPLYVTSDNGTEFSGEFAAMLERLGIIHVTTAVRHPQANGVCERMVGTIKRKLYSYCDGHPTHWISYLPRLRYAYMQEVHGATHYSPFEMVYGFSPQHPLPVNINAIGMHPASDKSYLDMVMQRNLVDAELCSHVEQLRRQHLRIDSEVKESILKAQNAEISRFERRKQQFHDALPTVKVGDYVFEVRESPRPMQSIADGPFRVISRNKDMAVLRTGTTKWDPVPKEFSRKIDFLAPCLTKRQALAKAYGLFPESADREAPLSCLVGTSLLLLEFAE